MDIQKWKKIRRSTATILTAISYILFAWILVSLGSKFPELGNINNQAVIIGFWVVIIVFVLLFSFMIFGVVQWGWQPEKKDE